MRHPPRGENGEQADLRSDEQEFIRMAAPDGISEQAGFRYRPKFSACNCRRQRMEQCVFIRRSGIQKIKAMGPAISGSMGAPSGHGIGNELQMAGKDFIAGESGNESNRAFVKDKKTDW